MSTFNILNIDKEELEIVLSAYHNGDGDFFLAGKKYWITNLFEIKIFEFDHPDRFDDFIELADRTQVTNTSFLGEKYLSPDVLRTGGSEITKNVLRGGFGSQKSNEDSNKVTSNMEIFISHSSKDAAIAEALINVLIKAYKFKNSQIRCTSVDGYKLPTGISTDEQLKSEIFNSRVFIGLLTSTSINSTYVLFEIGARWGANLPILPIICDTSGNLLLKGPLKSINVLDATNVSDIHQFIYDVGSHLNLKPEDTSGFLKEVQKFHELSLNVQNESEIEVNYSVGSKDDYELADEIIRSQSLIEWPEDYEMQLDYINRQEKAVANLKLGKPDDVSSEEFMRIRERAKSEWPYDFEMRLDQETKQIESLRALKKM